MSRRNQRGRPQNSKRLRAQKRTQAVVATPKGNFKANMAQNLVDLATVRVEGTCPSGKLRYPDHNAAAHALAMAKKKRERAGQAHVERRFYGGPDDPCGRGCGGYHLTSREAFIHRRPV